MPTKTHLTTLPLLFLTFLLLPNQSTSCSIGCLKCSSRQTCLICDIENFYFLSKGQCIHARPSFCLFALKMNQCVFCKPNFYLDRGKCLRTTTLRQNCVQNNLKECLMCEPGYYPFKGTYPSISININQYP